MDYLWGRRYFRDPKFKEIIGGIKCSEKEKKECIDQIKTTIKRNNHNVKTVLSNDILLKVYPEGISLLSDYYNSLSYSHKKSFEDQKYVMLLAYAPFLVELPLDELYKYTGLNFDGINHLVAMYKLEISEKEEDKKAVVDNTRKVYDLPLLKQLMEDYIETDTIDIKEFYKKHGITGNRFVLYLEVIKNIYPDLYEMVQIKKANPYENDWRIRYSMNKSEWSKEKFKKLIGGIDSTLEEKQENLMKIKEAIKENNSGTIVKLDKRVFLKAYPDSLDLLKQYYDSLIYAHKVRSYRENNYSDVFSRASINHWKDLLIKDRDTMLLIYAPYFASLSASNLGRYAKIFGLSMKEIHDMIVRYKQINSEQFGKELTEDKQYDLKLIREIVNEILVNNHTKKYLGEKYNLSGVTFDTYMEQLKNVDIELYNAVTAKLKQNSVNYYYKMKTLISSLYECIVHGINIGETTISFTMLDYYCLTNLSTSTLISYIKEHEQESDVQPYKNVILDFLKKSKNVGSFISAESMSKLGMAVEYNGKRSVFDIDFCTIIINYLKEKDIPINEKIVYTAARRYARGEVVLPLLISLEREEEHTDKSKQKK